MSHKKLLNEIEEKKLIDRYINEHKNMQQLSILFNCSRSTIKRILKRNQITIRGGRSIDNPHRKPKKFTKEQELEMIRLYVDEQKSTKEVASIIGNCTFYNVIYVLLSNNIPRRKNRGGYKGKEAHWLSGCKQREDKSRNWKGGRKINQDGYMEIINPNRFEDRKSRRYVLEHRYLMEQHLGKKLLPYEHVHHRNGIKTDNRIENLEIKTSTNHFGTVECPFCRKEFKIR